MWMQSPNGKTFKFAPTNNRLCFCNMWQKQISVLNSQCENSVFHSEQQMQQAREARNLCQMMGHPSAADYKTAIK